MPTCASVLSPLISRGALSDARTSALHYSMQAVVEVAGSSSNSLPWSSIRSAATPALGLDKTLASECSAAWLEQVSALLARDEYIELVNSSHSAIADGASTGSACVADEPRDWEACCSRLRSPAAPGCPASACSCDIGRGSRAAQLLPLLREPSVRVRLGSSLGRVLYLEQDGFLRPFDVATVVWPAGLLLALWAADRPAHANTWPDGGACPYHDSSAADGDSHQRAMRVLELGAGTGVASLAAALGFADAAPAGVSVLATDASDRSLSLLTANAALNGLGAVVSAQKLDWLVDADVSAAVAANGGRPFDVVIGAALMGLAADAGRLWPVLAALTEADGVVAIAHTTATIDSPPEGAGFVEVTRLSGLDYGLRTRWSANTSDFELVLLRRVPPL